MNNADIVVDLQFGSTGKGLLCGYLAEKNQYDVVVNANMPNAGHTYIDSKGQKMMNKVLPSGHVSPGVEHICIGPGSVFSEDQLMDEIEHAEALGYHIMDKVRIHPSAVLWQEVYAQSEKEMFNNVASTMQGSAMAQIDKVMRASGNQPLAAFQSEGTMIEDMVVDHAHYAEIMSEATQILVEGSQGYSLGINTQFYPYVTSRSCTPAAFLDYCGVPIRHMRHIYGVARTYPIRVGNTEGGYSGPVYEDQEEVTWDDIGVDPELTTVTQRERRVFTFSADQMIDSLHYCQPDGVFLNFANYCTEEELMAVVTAISELGQKMNLSSSLVRWIGTGPTYHDVTRTSHKSIIV